MNNDRAKFYTVVFFALVFLTIGRYLLNRKSDHPKVMIPAGSVVYLGKGTDAYVYVTKDFCGRMDTGSNERVTGKAFVFKDPKDSDKFSRNEWGFIDGAKVVYKP